MGYVRCMLRLNLLGLNIGEVILQKNCAELFSVSRTLYRSVSTKLGRTTKPTR